MGEVIVRPHSPISGSKIKRFLKCPTSFIPDDRDLADTSPKTAAIEGERAHDLAEKYTLEGAEALKGVRNKLMVSGAKMYGDFIHGQAGESTILTEQFVQMGWNFGFVDDATIGGYYDAAVLDKSNNRLLLFDYKFGFHVVESDTPQLTFYILAILLGDMRESDELPVWKDETNLALDAYADWTFTQSIIQPKRKDGTIHTTEITIDDIKKFAGEMFDAVAIYQDASAFDDGSCHSNPECRYCPKRTFCVKCQTADEVSGVGFNFDKRASDDGTNTTAEHSGAIPEKEGL